MTISRDLAGLIATADTTFYVSTTGSDSNGGLSSDDALATVNEAISRIANIKWGQYLPTIQLADGTYNENIMVNGAFTGTTLITIQGNSGDIDAVQITGSATLTVQNSGVCQLKWVELNSTGNAVFTSTNGLAYVADIEIAGATNCLNTYNGSIIVNGGITVSASSFQRFAFVHYLGWFQLASFPVTLVGTPNVTSYFIGVFGGSVARVTGVTWSGSATGQRYSVGTNAVLETFGQSDTWLPGTIAGTTSESGYYT